MSIPLIVFLGSVLPGAGFLCILILWVMNRIHPLTHENLSIAGLGLAISVVALVWQGYQKYVVDGSVGIMARVLSLLGLLVYTFGVYRHLLERQSAMAEQSESGGS